MSIFDLLFPKRCLGCGRIGTYCCDTCRQGITYIQSNEAICPVCEKPSIDGATHPKCQTRYTPDGLTSFFRYDGIIRKAVKTLKYRFVTNLAAEFISLVPPVALRGAVKQIGPGGICIPIPLYRTRLLTRGFNQAEVMGKYLSLRLSEEAGLHILMRTDMLRRTKQTIPQVAMKKREARLKNMEGAFTVERNVPVPKESVLLFDDVFTTGATMRAAANILKRHGTKRVWCVTMAR